MQVNAENTNAFNVHSPMRSVNGFIFPPLWFPTAMCSQSIGLLEIAAILTNAVQKSQGIGEKLPSSDEEGRREAPGGADQRTYFIDQHHPSLGWPRLCPPQLRRAACGYTVTQS